MASSIVLRQARYLCTASASASAAAAATTIAAAATTDTSSTTTPPIPTPTPMTISKAKYKLKSTHDADQALQIYSSISGNYATSASTRYIQDSAVKRLAKANRFTDIENFLETHKKDPNIKQEFFLSNLIRSYSVAGMFDHALKTYHQMEDLGTPRTSVSFNSLLSACVKAKKFEDVVKLFDEMPKRYGFDPDMVSYGILVKVYCEMGNVELAKETLKEMEEKGVEITSITYSTI